MGDNCNTYDADNCIPPVDSIEMLEIDHPFPDKISGNLFTTEIKSEDIGYLRGEDSDGNTTGKSHDNRIGDKLDYSTQLEYP